MAAGGILTLFEQEFPNYETIFENFQTAIFEEAITASAEKASKEGVSGYPEFKDKLLKLLKPMFCESSVTLSTTKAGDRFFLKFKDSVQREYFASNIDKQSDFTDNDLMSDYAKEPGLG